jgi:hypothetical protein
MFTTAGMMREASNARRRRATPGMARGRSCGQGRVPAESIPVMTMYGAEAALIAESITPRQRYSGASIGYQLASIIAGGPTLFISGYLLKTYNSTFPIGLYVVACAVVSITATLMLRDNTNREISHEAQYDNV